MTIFYVLNFLIYCREFLFLRLFSIRFSNFRSIDEILCSTFSFAELNISHLMNLIAVTSEVSGSNFGICGRVIIEGVCLEDTGMCQL